MPIPGPSEEFEVEAMPRETMFVEHPCDADPRAFGGVRGRGDAERDDVRGAPLRCRSQGLRRSSRSRRCRERRCSWSTLAMPIPGPSEEFEVEAMPRETMF